MRVSLLVMLLATAPLARAEEAANPTDPAPADAPVAEAAVAVPPLTLEPSVTGYLDSRLTYTHVPGGRLLPSRDVPAFANITEANFQLKLRWGDRALAYVDASYFYQRGQLFFDTDKDGQRFWIPDHDVPALRPLAVVSELYGNYDFSEHVRLTLGKKRIVWGPGFAQNPTDLLNPPKDPTDPTFQRAGSWLGRLEFPYEKFTFSLVGAARTLRQYGGLPSSLVYYPDYPTAEALKDRTDDRDGQPHFAAAARLYVLWHDTDVNLLYFFSNLSNDAYEHKNRGGLSLSHVFGNWEVHLEALAQTGSSRLYANPACVKDLASLAGCGFAHTSIAARDRLGDTALTPRVLAGTRYMLDDGGILSLEYDYVGDGYTKDEFADYVRLVLHGQQALARLPAGVPRPALPGATASDPGSPQKFTFDPLRRHYLFVTWQQPQVHDDFTLAATVILNLQDLSGQLVPSVTWSAREWLNLTATVFAPLPGAKSLAVDVDGKTYSEYGLVPADWRAFVSARAFF